MRPAYSSSARSLAGTDAGIVQTCHCPRTFPGLGDCARELLDLSFFSHEIPLGAFCVCISPALGGDWREAGCICF